MELADKLLSLKGVFAAEARYAVNYAERLLKLKCTRSIVTVLIH